jgi:hypothetical protein
VEATQPLEVVVEQLVAIGQEAIRGEETGLGQCSGMTPERRGIHRPLAAWSSADFVAVSPAWLGLPHAELGLYTIAP